jgi:hypothetical protein
LRGVENVQGRIAVIRSEKDSYLHLSISVISGPLCQA